MKDTEKDAATTSDQASVIHQGANNRIVGDTEGSVKIIYQKVIAIDGCLRAQPRCILNAPHQETI
ncbi:MAG: hypothetical protein ACHP7O_06210 [Burkholderiales bacterium]